MKTRPFIYILLIAGLAALASSCTDHRNDYLDEFKTMVYFRNGGEQDLTLYRTGEDGFYRIPVCKSGRDLSGTASAVVIPFDAAQMTSYNIKNETSYKLIPHELYSFVDADRQPLAEQGKVDLEFGSDDPYKLVYLGIKTVDLSALMEANPDNEYVLGLQVFADERISEDINVIILKPSIEVPYVGMVNSGVEVHKYSSSSPMLETYHNTVSLNMEENRWDFDCTISAGDAAWLKDYNNANGKEYELLPSSNYVISTKQLHFEKGELDASFDVEVNREGMDMLKEYALPIVITSCSKSEFGIDPKKDSYIINVRLDPDKITLTSDMVTVNYSETGYAGDDGGAPALVDGKESTFWHTPWTTHPESPDPVYGIYAQIALKSPLKSIVISYCNRLGNDNGIPTHVVIGVSNDGENWEIIEDGDQATDEMATSVVGQWITLPVMKHSTTFRFIRFGIAESAAGDLRVENTTAYAAVAELEIYGTDN